MAISSIGVGSGLPLNELLENLRTSENATLNLIQTRTKKEESRLSAYGTLKSSIEALQKAAADLGKSDSFGAMQTTVSGDAFTATSSTKAISGQYNVQITQLATAQSLSSANGVADNYRGTDPLVTSGTVTVSVTLGNGTVTELQLDAADTTLEGIVQAFNANKDVGANGTIVNNGTSNFLLLNARGSGTDAAITSITVTGDGSNTIDDLANVLNFNSGTGASMTQAEGTGLDAELSINGIDIVSKTNTIENAIEGVTLTLTKATGTTAQTLNVSRDDSVAKKAVEAFVTAYNSLQTQIKSLTSYNTETQASSALTGDSLARQVQSRVRDALNVSGASVNLSQLGVTTDPTNGTLKIDSDKLDAALRDNMGSVQELFAGTNGVVSRVNSVADTYIKSGGIISTTTDSINRTIKNLKDQYDSAADRIDQKMETYRQQFVQLDALIAGMNGTSAYLSQQLSMLGNISKGDK